MFWKVNNSLCEQQFGWAKKGSGWQVRRLNPHVDKRWKITALISIVIVQMEKRQYKFKNILERKLTELDDIKENTKD